MPHKKSGLSLKEAIAIVDSMRADSRVNAVRAFKLFIDLVYDVAYQNGQADMRKAQQEQAAPKANPFAMKEVAPGIFALTLDNPEDLFRLLDGLSGETVEERLERLRPDPRDDFI